jgi:hypothetical protein
MSSEFLIADYADFRGLLGSQDDSKTGRKKPPACGGPLAKAQRKG